MLNGKQKKPVDVLKRRNGCSKLIGNVTNAKANFFIQKDKITHEEGCHIKFQLKECKRQSTKEYSEII